MVILKKVTPLAILFSVIIFSNCFAMFGYGKIPESEIALGGLPLTPVKVFHYGKGFKITLIGRSDKYTLLFVNITANNGIKTPAGFTVGSNFADVKRYYESIGKPDSPGGKIGEKSTSNGKTSYEYYHGMLGISFEVDSQNKVVAICVGRELV